MITASPISRSFSDVSVDVESSSPELGQLNVSLQLKWFYPCLDRISCVFLFLLDIPYDALLT